MLCCVLFSYPILTLFNIDTMVLGVPLLYVYVFSIWGVLIFMIFIATGLRAKAGVPESESSSAIVTDDTAD